MTAAVAGAHAVRRIEPLRLLDVTAAVARERRVQRPGENQFVGREPLEPGRRDERDHGVRDRPFRRPQPDGPAAEQPLVIRRGARQLLGGVLRMREPLARHAGIGMRPQVDVGVAQQRQNRMVERRRRHFDLAARHGVPVLGNHPVQQLQLDFAELQLVVLVEAPPLGHQPAHARVGVEIERDRSRRACARPAGRADRCG